MAEPEFCRLVHRYVSQSVSVGRPRTLQSTSKGRLAVWRCHLYSVTCPKHFKRPENSLSSWPTPMLKSLKLGELGMDRDAFELPSEFRSEEVRSNVRSMVEIKTKL